MTFAFGRQVPSQGLLSALRKYNKKTIFRTGLRAGILRERARRIILCSAMPRSTAGDGRSSDMQSYIAASISQNAIVLSPTSACARGGRV